MLLRITWLYPRQNVLQTQTGSSQMLDDNPFFPTTILSHLLFWYNIKTGGVGQKSKSWHWPAQRFDRTTFKITQLWWIAVYHNTMCLALSQSREMFPFVSFWLCGSFSPPPVSVLLRRIPEVDQKTRVILLIRWQMTDEAREKYKLHSGQRGE